MSQRYRVIRADRAAKGVLVGDIVERYSGHDYGIANTDSRATGISHISVTRGQSPDEPFFTIPFEDVEPT